MRYYTRSSDSDILFLDEKKLRKRSRSKGFDCPICFCNSVEKSIKKKKISKRVTVKYKKKNPREKELNVLKKTKPCSVVTVKYKKKNRSEKELNVLQKKNLCSVVTVKYKKKNRSEKELNGLKKTKPCSVVLEKLNVKQFKRNFKTPTLKPIVKKELNQTIKPCSICIEEINLEHVLKFTKIFKPCSVVLKQSDFKPNIKQDKYYLGATHLKKEVLSITNCSSPQHRTQSAVTVKTEINLLSEQDEHKQLTSPHSTGEDERVTEYVCAHCSKQLPSKKALYYHVCNTKMKNGFLCEICFKNFDFYHLLIKHKSSHALSLSCSKSVRNRRKKSSPLIKLSTMEQSLRESNKLKCATPDKISKLKENNPPKRPRKSKIFLKNPACASTSTGQSSSNLEFLPYVWESDDSST